MGDVVIAGIGQTDVGEHWDLSLRQLAYQAVKQAMADAGGMHPQALYIGNMLAPQLIDQAHLGALVAEQVGLTGIEAMTIEAGEASGGAAIRAGYMAVASGWVDSAVVLGVEKVTDVSSGELQTALSSGSDSDYEAVHGLTQTAQAAILMRRYMHEYGVLRDAFAGFPINAHANAARNPHAMYQKMISEDAYHKAALVSDPLNLFDVAPLADGAAAMLLTRADLLPSEYPHPVVKIAASAIATDTLALHDRTDPLEFQAVRISVEEACRKAKITPLQIDLFELHDACSIFVVLTLEAAGFARRGEGWKLAKEECISLDGSLPISTMGGLKARGNPVGATGVYQAVEVAQQLRGEAGKNQLPHARRGMVQSLSGSASTAVTHILEILER